MKRFFAWITALLMLLSLAACSSTQTSTAAASQQASTSETGKSENELIAEENDILAANNWNVVQYAVLVHMMAQVSGLKAGELVHVIADAHIYDRHVPIIEQMLTEPEKPAPQFVIDPEVTDFYAFTKDSFHLEGYDPSPFEAKIPIAV